MHKLIRAKHLTFTDALIYAKFPYRGTLHSACYIGKFQLVAPRVEVEKQNMTPPTPLPQPMKQAGKGGIKLSLSLSKSLLPPRGQGKGHRAIFMFSELEQDTEDEIWQRQMAPQSTLLPRSPPLLLLPHLQLSEPRKAPAELQ